jgi:hypothetical protein
MRLKSGAGEAITLSRKVNSEAIEGHPGAMEYQPGILEVSTELGSTVARPGAGDPWAIMEHW